MQAQKRVLEYYANYTDEKGAFAIVQERRWLEGVLDLKLTAQDLDADAEQFSVFLSGKYQVHTAAVHDNADVLYSSEQ